MKIAALAGGVGASKLLCGLVNVMEPQDLTIIGNTGDDLEMHGLSISPDLDIVMYTLAGVVEEKTGWGIKDDTFHTLERLAALGRENWFRLGDKDLATHIHRTSLLRAGFTLTEVTETLRQLFGVEARILPMSDLPVRTMISTEAGKIHFQDYLVRQQAKPTVLGIDFEGVGEAVPAPRVLEALAEAEGIILCPSNPLISIGPILAVPGIREALQARRENVVAINPIVAGKSLKGPSDRMLQQLGHEVSAVGVAKLYRDVAGTFVIDSRDAGSKDSIEALGMSIEVRETVMKTLADKESLAHTCLELTEARRTEVGVS
jgi:LPPG:FO 2-phospho-L-lactate transferase